jgi:hypothetical protein
MLISKLPHQSSSSESVIGAIVLIQPSLEIKISILPRESERLLKAASVACLLVRSATAYETLVALDTAEMSATLEMRAFSRRPIIQTPEAPAWVNAFAATAPIPVPPPVMITTLPRAESSGLVGKWRDKVRNARLWCKLERLLGLPFLVVLLWY